MKNHDVELTLNALRIEQRPDVPLYVFGINGRLIHQFAAIQPARRDDEGVLAGYQRVRVEKHIREIRDYLEQEEAILPNAVVVAFDDSVTFKPQKGALRTEWGTPGQLRVRLPLPGKRKPALIVDGQQRVSALADLAPERTFPAVVVGFATPSDELQREQFLLVNRTKPLPRDLLNELVPHVHTVLPAVWRIRRVASSVVERLRFDKESPFFERIRGIGTAGDGTNISQAALLDVIEHSVRRHGVLAQYYSAEPGESDIDAMSDVVQTYYGGVERVWPDAWSKSPWSSRLVHGAGIVALGRLMDVVMTDIDVNSRQAEATVKRRLSRLRDRCAWTSGWWPVLGVAWNELQNTSQDKRRLAAYLLEEYGNS